MSKIHEAAYEHLEELASNNYQQQAKRSKPKSTARLMKLDQITSLTTQPTSMIKQLGKVHVNSIQTNFFINFVQGTIQAPNAKWIIPSIHQVVNTSTLCRIINRITYIRTHKTLDGRTTLTFLGTSIKEHLNNIKISNNKRGS